MSGRSPSISERRFSDPKELAVMSERIPVLVVARDPVSKAGVVSQLRHRPEVNVMTDGGLAAPVPETAGPMVAVVAADEVDEDAVRDLRAVRRGGCARVVLVATRLDDAGVVDAAEAGVSGLVRRSEATPERLVEVIRTAAAGDGSVPADLLGRLLDHVGRLQRQVLAPRGLSFSGLSPREADVLRLVADGLDTGEIADRLAYSERTVKNVLHDVTTRLQLRNRSHAVAYALRSGLI
jgi:DNA-binding NarL/FixJ family response regulator